MNQQVRHRHDILKRYRPQECPAGSWGPGRPGRRSICCAVQSGCREPAWHVAGDDESEPPCGPGQRHVQVGPAARGRLLDPGRVDDYHRVELEPFGQIPGGTVTIASRSGPGWTPSAAAVWAICAGGAITATRPVPVSSASRRTSPARSPPCRAHQGGSPESRTETGGSAPGGRSGGQCHRRLGDAVVYRALCRRVPGKFGHGRIGGLRVLQCRSAAAPCGPGWGSIAGGDASGLDSLDRARKGRWPRYRAGLTPAGDDEFLIRS
jgi:hypothetical protein